MTDKTNVININGNEYNQDEMTANQRYIIRQIKDLQTQEDELAFQLDQKKIAKNAFTRALINSVEEKDEFKTKEEVTQ